LLADQSKLLTLHLFLPGQFYQTILKVIQRINYILTLPFIPYNFPEHFLQANQQPLWFLIVGHPKQKLPVIFFLFLALSRYLQVIVLVFTAMFFIKMGCRLVIFIFFTNSWMILCKLIDVFPMTTDDSHAIYENIVDQQHILED